MGWTHGKLKHSICDVFVENDVKQKLCSMIHNHIIMYENLTEIK